MVKTKRKYGKAFTKKNDNSLFSTTSQGIYDYNSQIKKTIVERIKKLSFEDLEYLNKVINNITEYKYVENYLLEFSDNYYNK